LIESGPVGQEGFRGGSSSATSSDLARPDRTDYVGESASVLTSKQQVNLLPRANV
jgi:hypothetical protein